MAMGLEYNKSSSSVQRFILSTISPMRETCDLAVIGGGLVGASVFRRACELGLKAVLIERGALGGRSSGATLGFFFGALPYLPGDTETAAVCAGEAAFLLARCRPALERRSFLLPVYRDDPVGGGEAGELLALAREHASALFLTRIERLGPQDARALEPELAKEGLVCAFHYDAWAFDASGMARLLADEGRACGGRCFPGTKVIGLPVLGGAVAEVRCTDVHGASLAFSSKAVVNAAGGWAPDVAALAGCGTPELRFLRETLLVLPQEAARQSLIRLGQEGALLGLRGTLFGPVAEPFDGDPDARYASLPEGERLRALALKLLPGLKTEGSPRTLSSLRPRLSGRFQVFSGLRNFLTVSCGEIPLCRLAAEAALSALPLRTEKT
jgi:glycerol-3-phosphate dehydrogenase